MTRLRRVDCSGPGISRRRRGRGFEFLDEDGGRIEDPEVLGRIAELAIPPAWKEVWVCPYPMGHLQATGVDALVSLRPCRSVDAAAGQLLVREAGGEVLFPDAADGRLGASLMLDMRSRVVAARSEPILERLGALALPRSG